MLDICTISISQAVTRIVDEVEPHIHFKFPKAVKLCQFLNSSQMWYVACPQDLLDFSLTDFTQPRAYSCYVFGESNLLQSRTKSATEQFIICIYLYPAPHSDRGWGGQGGWYLFSFKVQKKGKKVRVILKFFSKMIN